MRQKIMTSISAGRAGASAIQNGTRKRRNAEEEARKKISEIQNDLAHAELPFNVARRPEIIELRKKRAAKAPQIALIRKYEGYCQVS